MAQVVWTRRAESDINEIRLFIAKDSFRYAELFIERIRIRTLVLARFPGMGKAVHDVRQKTYREIRVGPFRILYQISSDRKFVFIAAIVHAKRQLNRAL